MNIADVLARIPYVQLHELSAKINDDVVEVQMPPRTAIENHVGIIHAGALYTAAETAAGVAAWSIVAGDEAFVLLRKASVRYTRRASGAVVARAHATPAVARQARTAFSETRRADALVEVSVHDDQGETVFEGSFDYALRERRP